MKKLTNTSINFLPLVAIALVLIVWQIISALQLIPEFLLPSPLSVLQAFGDDYQALFSNSLVTLSEAFWGLFFGVGIGVILALIMDIFHPIYKALYPLLVISQTIPTIAIAPLLILWFGYGILPKVVLVVATTFFPIAVGMLDAFRSTDQDLITLMRTLGANTPKIYFYIKFPNALDAFFSSLKISVSYSLVSAVVSEWVGGFDGLGVYMTRVMKAYAYDKMFAVIFLISLLSLFLILIVNWIQYIITPWRRTNHV
ncbi:ABC transporter permease [Pediococcus stilesii]|uniref:ABC-type nitrate sulfonate bicarbonate transport system, permease component n=1 Tax=Pediococcus stilesii TaxID=331679 RepID=A0A0R2KWE6_9LACO|nr:ABC transporter permease [Pediococcus stilesii]KRN93919.1 ABC-type nitrate sulfonate bicarbonate transport system, permease component [Pediococcus stilesii]